MVGGADVGDETFEFDTGLREIGADGVLLVTGAGDDVERRVVQQRPDVLDEELHRQHIGAVGEAADKQDAARVGGSSAGTKAVQIYSVGQSDGGRRCHDAAILFAHGDYAVHVRQAAVSNLRQRSSSRRSSQRSSRRSSCS